MCRNNLSPQATFCPQCGHPQVGTEPEAAKPGGVADMSGAGLRELMAIIEQDLEVPFDTPMFPKFPGEGDLPAED